MEGHKRGRFCLSTGLFRGYVWMMKNIITKITILFVLASGVSVMGESDDNRNIDLRLTAEVGFLAVLDHTIQYGESGTRFNYSDEGGQDRLFPLTRFSVDIEIDGLHTVTFLYQPLELETRADNPAGLNMDGESFTGEGLRLLYSFPFYRLSYTYRFFDHDGWRIDAGGSLQLRNAGIEFESVGGDGFFRSADIGPVPLLKLRLRKDYAFPLWWGLEADGIYAPVSYLNGSDNETVGALLDASIRAGVILPSGTEPFVNLRYLGGGASNKETDGYVVNWLQFLTLSLGVSVGLD